MRPMAHVQRTRTSHHFPQGLGGGSPHSLLSQGRGTKQQGAARNVEMEERVCQGNARATDARPSRLEGLLTSSRPEVQIGGPEAASSHKRGMFNLDGV